jgi:Flp pilus assembly protein TadG
MNVPEIAPAPEVGSDVLPASADPVRRSGTRRRRGNRGQSLVEFAVVLPVMLAIGGVLIDAARLYQVWTTLESATRDAAQYLAMSSNDPYSPDYTWPGEDADSKAAYILGAATLYPVERSMSPASLASCAVPQVTTVYTQDTTATTGGTVANPSSTATVTVCIPFRTIFAYPFLTTNGAFYLRTQRTITMIMGR